MNQSRTIATPLFLPLILYVASAQAQLIEGDDLVLTDPTPDVVFDDTDTGGRTFRIRGFDEYFLVRYEPTSTSIFRYDPSGPKIAVGHAAQATGDFSTAIGAGTISSGAAGTALGSSASSGGTSSTAVGVSASSIGDSGTALGASASAGGHFGTALGTFALSSGQRSIALGISASSSELESTAIGYSANAVAWKSTAIGPLAVANTSNTIILGPVPGLNLATEYVDVGMGTTLPFQPLHVHRDDGTAGVLVEETNAEVAPRTLFTLANPGNTKFEIINTDAMNSWAFTNSGDEFRISLQDSGMVELKVFNNGDALLAGVLYENSDRNAKTDIVQVDLQEVLTKVTEIPIAEWSYQDGPDVRHIGPMAQDFHAAFATGSSDRQLASLDVGGVAIASIQALEIRNRELESAIEALRKELDQLKALIMR